MASKSTAPPSLLTTSRHLIEQLELFEESLELRKRQTVRHVLNDFAVIKQAILDVKGSQDQVANIPERSEPVPILAHQLPEEFLVENPPKTCYRIVAKESNYVTGVPYLKYLPEQGQLRPRDATVSLTLKAARDHLSWKHCPTPLTSVFSEKTCALEWAARLQARHKGIEYILMGIDTSNLHTEHLYDATKLAKYLDLPDFRINYHSCEYLWFGVIDTRRITSVENLGAAFPSTPK